MVVKFLLLGVVLFIIYIAFFKKTAISEEKKEQKRSNKKNNSDTMIECSECSTFVSEKEAIIKDAKFFCSKECAKLR